MTIETTEPSVGTDARPATDPCCGSPSTTAIRVANPCCGTVADAQASGGCCGPAAKAEAIATRAGCCG